MYCASSTADDESCWLFSKPQWYAFLLQRAGKFLFTISSLFNQSYAKKFLERRCRPQSRSSLPIGGYGTTRSLRPDGEPIEGSSSRLVFSSRRVAPVGRSHRCADTEIHRSRARCGVGQFELEVSTALLAEKILVSPYEFAWLWRLASKMSGIWGNRTHWYEKLASWMFCPCDFWPCRYLRFRANQRRQAKKKYASWQPEDNTHRVLA